LRSGTDCRPWLEGITLTDGRDRVSWALEKSKQCTTRSLYKALTTGCVRDIRMMTVWSCDIPLKVKIFIWMTSHDRIQLVVQLRKRNGQVQKSALHVTKLKPLPIYYFNGLLLCFCGPSCEICLAGQNCQRAVKNFF
jgi:hypothetical protein